MRADDADQFAGGDDFGFLPELWEMALIASDHRQEKRQRLNTENTEAEARSSQRKS
jgi:hypothetical protein